MKRLLLLFAIMGLLFPVFGQNPPGDDGDWDTLPAEAPLDESAGMFAGAIVVMGAYILYRKRKNAN